MPNRRGTRTTTLIRTIRQSLRALGRNLGRLATSAASTEMASFRAARKPRRKITITPARRAALKLQGQYMGYIRGLKPKQKAAVKAVREKKGVRAAIGVARRMGKVA